MILTTLRALIPPPGMIAIRPSAAFTSCAKPTRCFGADSRPPAVRIRCAPVWITDSSASSRSPDTSNARWKVTGRGCARSTRLFVRSTSTLPLASRSPRTTPSGGTLVRSVVPAPDQTRFALQRAGTRIRYLGVHRSSQRATQALCLDQECRCHSAQHWPVRFPHYGCAWPKQYVRNQ